MISFYKENTVIMNFLAHIYLSGTSDEILVGNFIGDYVKGNKFNDYPDKIKEGILLHRQIDNFTDTNDIVRETKSHFQSSYGKYAGIIVDIVYDHFLANNWKKYSDMGLESFISRLFHTLTGFVYVFPASVNSFFPSFVTNNWLGRYITLNGIEGVLNGMSQKTSLPNETKSAMHTLVSKYTQIEDEFNSYFPEIIDFVESSYEVNLRGHFNQKIFPVAS